MWLVLFDFDFEKSKDSLTLYLLPQFKKICQVISTNGFMSYSYKFNPFFKETWTIQKQSIHIIF